MNGEMHQVSRIAAAAKNALQTNTAISFSPGLYENSILFQFLPRKGLFGDRSGKAVTITEWYQLCRSKGLASVILLVPLAVEDRGILGFSNTTQSILVCYFKNQRVTYFAPYWSFDSAQKAWDILYTEHEWQHAPLDLPRFQNPTNGFLSVLIKIKAFAEEIDYPNFANLFQKAADILSGELNLSTLEQKQALPAIPADHQRLFLAASYADVFGAMGSWSDSPPYSAHQKGLDLEFETLSNELLKQIRLAVLFAVNEW